MDVMVEFEEEENCLEDEGVGLCLQKGKEVAGEDWLL